MDTQTQIDRLIELAIIQRTELKQLVEQLPQLREHLNAEVEKVFEETEPQLRAELEEWTTKQTADKTAALGVTLEAKIAELAKSLEVSTQARYNAIIAEREQNARLAAEAEAKIAEHAASLPSAVKEIVTAELARFPRAGEIDQLRKEFAEPRGLNPRGKWQAGETYNRLDLVTYNGDSFVSNIDGNTEKPSRNAANWTLNAARGAYGGGGGITSLNDVLNAPTSGQIIGSQNGQYVPKTLVAGANITINETASAITIIGDEGQISLQDGTAAAPSLFFTNDTDTGIYRPAANTLGISTSGVQRMYVDDNGITTVGAGATFDGSVHAANGNANNPSFSFSGDQDTGFFRHQPNEIGIALGGTQYATLTSTTFSITPVVTMASSLRVNGTTDSSSKDTGAIVTEGGLGVEKSATIGGNLTVSGADGVTSSGTPWAFLSNNGSLGGYAFYSSGASADQKYWQWQHGSAIGDGTLRLRALNDALSSGTNALVITRTGISSTAVQVGGNLTVSGTGTSTFSGNLNLNGTDKSILLNGASTQFSREIDVRIAGDTEGRLLIRGGGSLLWGDGAGGFDSTLARTAANMLTITGGLTTSGNLTVSGTGNSTFAGNVVSKNTAILFGDGVDNSASLYATGGPVKFWANATEAARIFANGNFFIGASPTDGGQKLQVSGTAQLYTSNGQVNIAPESTTAQIQALRVSADATLRLTRSAVADWDFVAGTDLVIKRNNSTFLTINQYQTATFPGEIKALGATNAFTWAKDSSSTKAWGIGSNGWAGLSGGDGSMIFGVYTGSGWYKAFELSNGTTSNATLTGNLTVSGTGTSSVAGNVNVAASASGTAILGLGVTPNTWYSSSAFAAVQMRGISLFGNAGGAGGILAGNQYLDSGGTWRFVADGAGSWYSFQSGIHQWYTAAAGLAGGAATNTELMRLATNGNFLIGTPTDSGNGKVQLATHTTSAGGIGFGTDVSLYRESSVKLTANSTGSSLTLALAVGGTQKAIIASDGTTAYLGATAAGGSTILYSGNAATALTLDSSQNATFAGQVTTSGASGGFRFDPRDGSGANWLWYNPTGDDARLYNTSGSGDVLTITNAGNATFAGNIKTAAPSGGTAATWRLGTVASVSPTSPNRTIEVEIGGTTYYIHAKTTNN